MTNSTASEAAITTVKLSRNAKIIAASVGGVLLLCAIIGSQRGGSTNGFSMGGGRAGDRLAQLHQAYAELTQRSNDCTAQSNEALQATQRSVINGGGVMPQPACVEEMQMWVGQMAMLEKEIHELETGDHSTQVMDYVPGLHQPDTSGRVGTWTRQAIRGTTKYRDESGQTYELATAPYYYRDRASGNVYASGQSQAPADGHDYDQLQPLE